MVLYEIYREDGGNGITFVHMHVYMCSNPFVFLPFREFPPSTKTL
jgi:hypothetical protein